MPTHRMMSRSCFWGIRLATPMPTKPPISELPLRRRRGAVVLAEEKDHAGHAVDDHRQQHLQPVDLVDVIQPGEGEPGQHQHADASAEIPAVQGDDQLQCSDECQPRHGSTV